MAVNTAFRAACLPQPLDENFRHSHLRQTLAGGGTISGTRTVDRTRPAASELEALLTMPGEAPAPAVEAGASIPSGVQIAADCGGG